MAKVPSSTTRIALAREVTEGVNPGTGFVYQRYNTADLSNAFESIESEEIRPGRKPTGGIVVDATGTVNLQSQFSAVNFDSILEGGMLSTWSTAVTATPKSIDISNIVGTTFTLTDAATSGAFTNVVVGQWLKLSGFNINTGTVFAHVLTKTSANVIGCEGFRDSGVGTFVPVVVEPGQTDIVTSGSRLTIGETKHTFTIQAELHTPSATDVYRLWKKCFVGSMGMQIAPKQLCRFNVNFQGGVSSTSTTNTAGTVADSVPSPLMNAISHVRQIMVGDFGVPTTAKLTNLTWNLNNNPEALPAIAVFGADEIVPGVCQIQGSASIYLENATLLGQIESLVPSKLAFMMQDANGAGYIFTMNSLDWTADPTPIRGRTGAVIIDAAWTGKVDAANEAFTIDRF